ncbi:MAG: 3-oxoadipate enol-lactonase [Paracoccaceae bacterium]
MPFLYSSEGTIHWQQTGPTEGPALVLAHALGLDLSLWDRVIPLLPPSLRIVRYDLRGHGGSACPPPPYRMGTLVADAERLLDSLNIRDCVFVGLSVGGLVAQGLAVKRLDQVRAIVLSNTAAKIGTASTWDNRIQTVRRGGIDSIADATMERWFSRSTRTSPEARSTRDLLYQTREEGYIGVCAAIAGTDFYETTATLTLPTLAIAGSEDGSTPPDLVRETADLVKGSRFALIRGAGHLPPADKPEEYAAILAEFLRSIGHV